jgi:hypothetical protein
MKKGIWLVALVATVAGFACGEPVETIDMVQPHYVKKSLFEGEWHYKQTVVDVSPVLTSTFVGYEAALEKVKWKIDADWLTAYRAHEAIPGLDEDATLEGAEYYGDPVFSCSVSHFDIKRSYNAATAEMGNTITENTSDRPWFDREYMRVNWAGCHSSSTAAVWSESRMGVKANDYVRETEVYDPDHLQLNDDYIQMTEVGTLRANSSNCYYLYGTFNCGSAEARLRHSFAKIERDADGELVEQYEPRDYRDTVEVRDGEGQTMRKLWLAVPLGATTEGKEFACTPELIEYLNSRDDVRQDYTRHDCDEVHYEQFGRHGFFRSERHEYDRRVGGGHDDNRLHYASLHNIWRNPYQMVDGKKVSRPHAERMPKPVIYYLNVNFPGDLEDVAGQIATDWDGPFMDAVKGATGHSEETVRGMLRDTSDGEDWQFLDGDTNAQGGMFQIRRNTCSVQGVNAYLAAQPGLTDVVEEATGGGVEDMARGNLKRVCAGLTHFSRARGVTPFTWQQVGDIRYSMLNWINEQQPSGPLGYGPSAVDKETGRIQSGTANVYGASVDTYARSASDVVRAMNADLDLNALLSGKSYTDWIEGGTSFADMEYEMTEELERDLNSRFGNFRVEEAYGDYRFEDGRINPVELQRQMHNRLTDPMPGDPMHSASRAPVDEGKARLEALKQHPAFRARMLNNQNLAMVRPLYGLGPDDELTEEAEEAAVNLGMNPTEFSKMQRERFEFLQDNNIYMAEFLDDSIIGQALSMRGMDPELVYQTLRKEVFRAVMLHEIGHTIGMSHNFEASHDALNYQDEFWEIRDQYDEADWAAQRLPEYRYSSIMEYGSRFNSDAKGLGKYDYATIKFGYGGVTEEFAPDVAVSSTYSFEVFANGYHTIPDLLGGDFNSIKKRVDVKIDDHVAGLQDGLAENTRKLMEDPGRPASDYFFTREVPYGYCFDSYRGNLRCQVWDEGARYTETVKAAIQNYWNYYVFNNYRRGRNESGFINGYFGRQGRIGWYLTTFFRYYYFYQQWNIGLRNDLQEAALIGLNFINQVLGTPYPGPHCFDAEKNQYIPFNMASPEAQERCDVVDVPVGTGREHEIRYNEEYYYSIDYIGSYYDKLNLLYYLSDTSTAFFRVANLGDSRAFSIGYYRIFRDELLGLMRDMMFAWLGEETGEAYSSYVLPDDKNVLPKALVAGEAFGQEPERMEGTPQVYAPMGYNMLFQGLALGAVFNTSTYDSELDFDEYIAIAEKGSSDARTYPEGWLVATFAHPDTGVIYEAGQTRDGNSISYDLLNRAQAYADEVWTPAFEDVQSKPDNAGARAIFEEASRKMGQYGDLINDLRLLRSAVDFGDD